MPEVNMDAQLRVIDLSGRELEKVKLSSGPGLKELQTANWTAGAYLLELKLDNVAIGQLKLLVQR